MIHIKVFRKKEIAQALTKTILVLYDDLVKQGNYAFLLCCRYKKDALEIFISQVHGFSNPHPMLMRFRTCIKQICLSQMLEVQKKIHHM